MQRPTNIAQYMKLRIKSIIWNIRKQKTTTQNKNKKKEPKKMRKVKVFGTTSSDPTLVS